MTDLGLLLVSVICRYYAEWGAGEGYVAAVGRGVYRSGPGAVRGMVMGCVLPAIG